MSTHLYWSAVCSLLALLCQVGWAAAPIRTLDLLGRFGIPLDEADTASSHESHKHNDPIPVVNVDLTMCFDYESNADEADVVAAQNSILSNIEKAPEVQHYLPSTYDAMMEFCQSLDIHKYFESLGITDKQIEFDVTVLMFRPTHLELAGDLVDISALAYMYAAQTSRDQMIFAMCAHLALQKYRAYQVPEITYRHYINSVVPALKCFQEHYDGDLDKFAMRWGDPIPIYLFGRRLCQGRGSCRDDFLPLDPTSLLDFKINGQGQLYCPHMDVVRQYDTRRKIRFMKGVVDRWSDLGKSKMDRTTRRLLRDAKDVLKCLRKHHDDDPESFVTKYGAKFIFDHFGQVCAGGPVTCRTPQRSRKRSRAGTRRST